MELVEQRECVKSSRMQGLVNGFLPILQKGMMIEAANEKDCSGTIFDHVERVRDLMICYRK